eukprot:gnl/Ergobibamus_cyprinoides/3777.p1 GENE.gnl/Ergobibamus_cyprinoides/3777~~gnl/Ergobibamus_cyprinoides/3777.p1  ORF type:complete len:255 (+),score=79.48 gnl/Ergobibamus_cyprinoides/3777:340-1104(+)
MAVAAEAAAADLPALQAAADAAATTAAVAGKTAADYTAQFSTFRRNLGLLLKCLLDYVEPISMLDPAQLAAHICSILSSIEKVTIRDVLIQSGALDASAASDAVPAELTYASEELDPKELADALDPDAAVRVTLAIFYFYNITRRLEEVTDARADAIVDGIAEAEIVDVLLRILMVHAGQLPEDTVLTALEAFASLADFEAWEDVAERIFAKSETMANFLDVFSMVFQPLLDDASEIARGAAVIDVEAWCRRHL